MTNENEMSDAQEERSQIETLESLDIASLRKYAKLMRIASQRDWQREDYVEAIKTKQAAQNVAVVFDSSNAPAPGHARVLIHRDPSPGAKNSPIQLGVNGRIIHIPRGIEVDVPIPFIEVLKNSKGQRPVQDESPSSNAPTGTYKWEEVTSYPFQVTAITPGGQFTNPHDSRSANWERRKAFHKAFGRFPTDGELKEAMRAKIIKDM